MRIFYMIAILNLNLIMMNPIKIIILRRVSSMVIEILNVLNYLSSC